MSDRFQLKQVTTECIRPHSGKNKPNNGLVGSVPRSGLAAMPGESQALREATGDDHHMGRGGNHTLASGKPAQQLLFGKSRQGTREVKLSISEQAVHDDQTAVQAYQAMGGIITINDFGARHWRVDGQWHRESGPAIEGADGHKEWWLNGQLHREAGPAVEHVDGSKSWWLNGRKHREDGPAIEGAYVSKQWYLNGQRHRDDGPAIERRNGGKDWYQNDQRHRTDGPAVETADGTQQWWLNDQEYPNERAWLRARLALNEAAQ